jgi:translation initiation factor IF-2
VNRPRAPKAASVGRARRLCPAPCHPSSPHPASRPHASRSNPGVAPTNPTWPTSPPRSSVRRSPRLSPPAGASTTTSTEPRPGCGSAKPRASLCSSRTGPRAMPWASCSSSKTPPGRADPPSRLPPPRVRVGPGPGLRAPRGTHHLVPSPRRPRPDRRRRARQPRLRPRAHQDRLHHSSAEPRRGGSLRASALFIAERVARSARLTARQSRCHPSSTRQRSTSPLQARAGPPSPWKLAPSHEYPAPSARTRVPSALPECPAPRAQPRAYSPSALRQELAKPQPRTTSPRTAPAPGSRAGWRSRSPRRPRCRPPGAAPPSPAAPAARGSPGGPPASPGSGSARRPR